jgi:hypothetical protein
MDLKEERARLEELEEQAEALRVEAKALEDKVDRGITRLNKETGGCDCFYLHRPCPGHPGK